VGDQVALIVAETEKQAAHARDLIVVEYEDLPVLTDPREAMKDGAVDFIEKPFKNEMLLERVKQSLAHDVAERAEQKSHLEAASRISALTPREREVMELLIQGKRNKIIASELGISNRTVEAHRAKIMEKMQAHSLSDIVRVNFAAADVPPG
jgi:FixJ family two-component response regulator